MDKLSLDHNAVSLDIRIGENYMSPSSLHIEVQILIIRGWA